MTAPTVHTPATANALASLVTELPCDTPAGTADGDLLIAAANWRNAADFNDTTLSLADYVVLRLGSEPAAIATDAVTWQRTASSEPASRTFVSSTSGKAVAGIARISGHDGVQTSAVVQGSSLAATAPSLTADAADSLLICVFAIRTDDTLDSPAGMTELWDLAATGGGLSSKVRLRADWEVVPAGATGTRESAIGSSRDWVAFSILVAPGGPAGVTGSLAVTEDDDTLAASGTFLPPPAADPANLQAVVDGSDVELTWDASPMAS